MEALFHVTALSNFARAYDKYARSYDKARIPESTYPGRFFLLSRDELAIGVAKAGHLPGRTGLAGDRLIALETRAAAEELRPNLRTGRGRYVERGDVRVEAVHFIDAAATLVATSVEEVYARSLALVSAGLPGFAALRPRSVSVLPVARACPARCPFCFSRASVSADVVMAAIDWGRVDEVLAAARDAGAERAVITGGGEPTLLRAAELERLVGACARRFAKVVLISNGFAWREAASRMTRLRALADAGLAVLALSRHHEDDAVHAARMGLETDSAATAAAWRTLPGRRLRLVCVLQRGGVEDAAGLARYLDWAVATGADEVCFKELYVASSVESEYHDREANAWSAGHQVSLRLVLDAAAAYGWTAAERLPWGAPVYDLVWRGRPLRVAAYTEPSVLWERSHGVCRSWNLMADGRCLASLEDRRSEVLTRGLPGLSIVP